MKSSEWRPRWYYVLRNRTSGKLYFGQTVREDMSKYLGSGVYWVNHCQKYGGHNRDNVEVLWKEWILDKSTATELLEVTRQSEGEYWLLEEKKWANRVPETVDTTTPLANLSDEDRTRFGKKGGKVGGKKSASQSNHNSKKWTREDHQRAGRLGGLANARPFLFQGKIYPSMSETTRQTGHGRWKLLKLNGTFL